MSSVGVGQRVNPKFADHLDLRSGRDWEDFCARRTTKPQCVLCLATTAPPTTPFRQDDDADACGMGSSGSSGGKSVPSSDGTVDANRQKKCQPARVLRVASADSDDGSSSDDPRSGKADEKPARKRRRARVEQAEEEDVEVCVKVHFV